jgi:hypothetical protein
MKFALCLLVVLPLALSVPVNVDEKRFIFGHIQLPSGKRSFDPLAYVLN